MSEIVSPATVQSEPSVLRPLIHQEWKLCRGPIVGLSVLWIIGLWALVIFHHPVWLMIIGLIYVLIVTSSQGGRDVIDGTEEFSFTLPPGRGPLFVSRLTPGVLFLAANGLLGGVAIAFNLPQRLWWIVFSSGLTDPFPRVEEPLWYAMALMVPMAAHAITFTTAALVVTRAGVNLSWLAGFAGAGAIVWAGTIAEELLWNSPTGFLTSPALLAVSVLAPFGGYQAYLRKEASGSSGVAAGKSNSMGLLIIAAIVAAILVTLMLLFFLRSNSIRNSAVIENRQREIEQIRNVERKQNAESEER